MLDQDLHFNKTPRDLHAVKPGELWEAKPVHKEHGHTTPQCHMHAHTDNATDWRSRKSPNSWAMIVNVKMMKAHTRIS
jgi:hypothetical protein